MKGVALRYLSWIGGLMVAVCALSAQAGMFPDVPDVVFCTVELPQADFQRARVAFYLDARSESGITQYLTLSPAAQALRIDANGVVSSQSNLPDCNGATVAELREAGRTYDFQGG